MNSFLASVPKDVIENDVYDSVASQVHMLTIPGRGDPKDERRYLEKINRIIQGGQQFGLTELKPLDESRFDELLEAICKLQVVGSRNEILRIMTNLLTSCGIPASALKK
jgi:hypothetical protein